MFLKGEDFFFASGRSEGTRIQSHNGVVIHAGSMFFKCFSNYEEYSYFLRCLASARANLILQTAKRGERETH